MEKEKFIFLRKRSTVITKGLRRIPNVYLYNGRQNKTLTLAKKLTGMKLGVLCLTKKLGKIIHDSVRNRKKKLKLKNKGKK